MAHVGRYYRLHFRRDLATDVGNNNKAWARAYDVGAAFLSGTVGNLLVNSRFRVTAINERTFNGAMWQSNLLPLAGRLIRYQIECSSAAGFPLVMARVRVIDQTLGNLIEVNANRSDNANYQTVEAKRLYSGPSNPALLNTDGPNVLFQLFFVGWTP